MFETVEEIIDRISKVSTEQQLIDLLHDIAISRTQNIAVYHTAYGIYAVENKIYNTLHVFMKKEVHEAMGAESVDRTLASIVVLKETKTDV